MEELIYRIVVYGKTNEGLSNEKEWRKLFLLKKVYNTTKGRNAVQSNQPVRKKN